MEPIGPTLSADIIPLLSAIKTECTAKGGVRSAASIFSAVINKDRHLRILEKEAEYIIYQYIGYLIIVTDYIDADILVRSVHITNDVHYLKKEAKLISEYLWGGNFISMFLRNYENK